MSSESPGPPPGVEAAGPVPFKVIFHRTQVVIANLTVAALSLKEVGNFVKEAQRLGMGIDFALYFVTFTIKVSLATVLNCFVLALPIAGLIHYIGTLRYRAEHR